MLFPLPEGPTTATISRGFDLQVQPPERDRLGAVPSEDLEDVDQLERGRLGVAAGLLRLDVQAAEPQGCLHRVSPTGGSR